MKRRSIYQILPSICLAIFLLGCAEPEQAEDPKSQSIINQKTDEIGEFKTDGNDKQADMQVKSNAGPLSAVGGAYGFAVGEISKQAVQRAVQFFQAEHGRFPKDHAEFMEKIIKANSIKLPVLPGKRRYQYDVENHELVIVEAE
ncbi:MAG: hypothetical protein P8J27_15785 [Mariniblastus sp.]|nr:hypothetical protein [Mariniblastus sp.]